MLAAATSAPTIHLDTKVVLIALALVVLGTVARHLEARDRQRRREARTQRQREYRRYLRSDDWKRNRAPALERAGGFCEDCGSKSDLDVHHRTYARKGAEQPDDLVALCRRCHKERHAGKRTTLDWIALRIVRWWRIRRYRKAVA